MQALDKRNFQCELDSLIKSLECKPKLMLHACCAPCSSYVLELLSEYFDITMLYYNPNITPKEEYDKRLSELERLMREAPFGKNVKVKQCDYDPERFFEIAKGLESLPEGDERCFRCYELRLRETVKTALDDGSDYFTTTLSISPYKNSKKLAEISIELEKEWGVKWLPSDFKKKGGYKRSIELSKEYGLYRQNYCGCIFSKMQSELKTKKDSSD